jgi:predicted nucleic acid-binding protein
VTRYVIGPDVALELVASRAKLPAHHRLLAPTLLRSQVLAHLYARVQRGDLQRREADAQLDYLRALQIRLLGDRVLQRQAWKIAQELAWADTFVAEYIALTKLQADALVTRDPSIQSSARRFVGVAALEDLLQ